MEVISLWISNRIAEIVNLLFSHYLIAGSIKYLEVALSVWHDWQRRLPIESAVMQLAVGMIPGRNLGERSTSRSAKNNSRVID